MNKKNLIHIFGILLLFLFINFVNINISEISFISPDEASNYIITKTYSETNNLYIEDNNLDIDLGNNLHQRGLITYNNKIVPFNFLGFNLFNRINFLIGNDFMIKIIQNILFILLMIYLYKITKLFFNNNKFYLVYIAILSLPPILFYYNFAYMNALGGVTFMLITIYYLFIFNKNKNSKSLFLFIFFMLISIWFRYEFVLFFIFLLILNFSLNYKDYLNKKILIRIIITTLLGIIVFVFPLLIINYNTYGDCLTYGYKVFNQVFFPDRIEGNFINKISQILFPGATFNLEYLKKNIFLYIFILNPLFLVFFIYLLIKKKIYKSISIYFLWIIYLFFLRGTAEFYGYNTSNLILNSAIVRYWLPLYLIIAIMIIYFLYLIKFKIIKIIIIFFLIIYGNFLFINDNGLLNTIDGLKKQIEINNEVKKVVDINDYIINPLNEKHFFLIAKPISWWGGAVDAQNHFNSTILSNTIITLLNRNETIYGYESRYFNKNQIKELENHGLEFKKTEIYNLYEIKIKNETSN
jgi:hypothetical protein